MVKILKVLAYKRLDLPKALLEKQLCSYKRTLLPGEPLISFKHNFSLTFDDASFHFYHTLFPLLKKYKLRVLLALPTNYILEKSNLSPEERLSVPHTLIMQ